MFNYGEILQIDNRCIIMDVTNGVKVKSTEVSVTYLVLWRKCTFIKLEGSYSFLALVKWYFFSKLNNSYSVGFHKGRVSICHL